MARPIMRNARKPFLNAEEIHPAEKKLPDLL
jgi:hypothetical protein